jgi:hypothetical protein
MLGTLYIKWDKFELSEMFISVQDFWSIRGKKKPWKLIKLRKSKKLVQKTLN